MDISVGVQLRPWVEVNWYYNVIFLGIASQGIVESSFRFADDSYLSHIGRWFPSADTWSRQAQLGLFAAAVVCRAAGLRLSAAVTMTSCE